VRKAISTILLVLLALVLLVVGFVLVVATTPVGERFVTRQVNNYLAKKLKSPFRIGRISYKIPDYIELNDVFFQTPKGDTLLLGQRLFVDVDMLGLLNNRVAINQIDLEKVRLNISRMLPDRSVGPPAFNFNYLLDAFVPPGQPQPAPNLADTTTAPLDINLKAITFKDVRVKYRDDVTGADVNAYVDTLRANFEKTDIANNTYRLKDLTVDGLDARARIYKGLPTPDSPPSPDTLDIGLGKWQLNRARWDVNLEEQKMTTAGQIQGLTMESDYFFYNSERYGIKSLVVNGVNVRYDDLTQPKLRRGLDYAHLDLRDLNFTSQDLRYDPRQLSGKVRQARMRDKSGFVLQRLDGDVLYTDKTTSLTNLWIQTPRTLLRDQVVLRYDSLAQLNNPRQANRVRVAVNLRQSVLALSDVLLLAPQLAGTLKSQQTATIRVNARATGTLAALNLPVLELAALSGTRIRARGQLTNVTNPDRLGLDLTITEAVTRLADIQRVVPKNTLPDAIDLPPQLQLSGRVQGLLNDLNLQTRLNTTWGNATFDGRLQGFVAGRAQAYSGTLALADFRAEKWLKDAKTYGPVTAIATVNGSGLDYKTMNTSFRMNVDEATLLGYRYQNLVASGQLARGQLALRAVSDDPNARLNLDTRVGLASDYPSITGTMDITQLNLQRLKLYDESLELRGKINLDMASTDPARPIGTITTDGAVVRFKGKSYPMDEVFVRASAEGNRKIIDARVPFAQVNLDGQFAYDRLYDIVASEFSRYFAVPGLTYRNTPPPYDFRVNAKAYQHPLLQAFAPGLTRLDTVRLSAYLDSRQDTTLAATLQTGIIEYDTTVIRNARLTIRATNATGATATTPALPVGIAAPQKGLANLANLFNSNELQPITFGRGQLLIRGTINSATSSGIQIGETRLTGAAANNRLSFQMVSKDSVGRDVYGLAGQVATLGQDYRVQLARNGLLLNYQNWTADTTGYVQYGPQGLFVNRLQLRYRREYIEVASTETYANAPLRITIRNFQLADAARIANQDTTLASGLLDGTVVLRDYLGADSQLSFVGTVNVDSLRVMEKPIGNLTSRFTNQTDGRVGINVALQSPDNQATVNGTYNGANSGLDLAVDLQKLAARTIEAFSFGELRRANGQLTGQFTVRGTTNDPKLNGQIAFDSVAFNIKQLNATYRIDQERLLFDGSTVNLSNFTLADTLGRTLNTSGTVTLTNLPNASYNLTVQARDFLALNAARKDNDYVYGKASVSADLRIRGAGAKASIVGDVRVEENTKVSFVLPDDTPELNDARQTVTFIDHKDTLALSKYLVKPKADTVNTRIAFNQLDDATISLNLEVDEKSEFTIVVDELNGDYLRARGNATLNVTVDPSGGIQVLGRYEVTEGEYALTYEVLKRQFKIQKGSSITWTGDPLAAQVDITAIYEVRTAPANLVANEIAGQSAGQYQVKLPFNVLLKIGNNLAKPDLTFDIVRPTTGNNNALTAGGVVQTVDNKLAVLRRDESQINKQVFALLVLGNFISENSSDFFSSGNSGGALASAEDIARNSVSKVLSEQLERFASSLIKGVDVNFNLNSTNQATKADGSRASQTNLNVGLSKSFLSGRLSVQVGRNFMLENNTGIQRNPSEVFDNFSLNYNITRDGRYVLRGYRRNEQQTVLEGYVIETGVGFIINVDYNTYADLRRRRKEEDTL
jgi:translocation and assembly module TamB